MTDPEAPAHVRTTLEALYRAESGRIRATLIRLLGSFDLAEDAVQDAFAAALRLWPQQGIPAHPRSWLISTGRFRAIDALRRHSRLEAAQEKLAAHIEADSHTPAAPPDEDTHLADDHLRLIFTCCHPALPQEARVALTLREVCGLTTEEIAHAYLTPAPTLAQRIVRAKALIRTQRLPYHVPTAEELPQRLAAVLQVVYLIFNEGYYASTGPALNRAALSAEAIRLGRLLLALLPEPEVQGLLALMLLHESRRSARSTAAGDLILLEQQDRSLWHRGHMTEGLALVEHALATRRFGPYTLQAAIAAVHAEASEAANTDWAQIVALYTALARLAPSPMVELNRAVALAMCKGPAVALPVVEALLTHDRLRHYALAHATRADLCRRLGQHAEARASYARALSLTHQEPEQRFLQRRLQELP